MPCGKPSTGRFQVEGEPEPQNLCPEHLAAQQTKRPVPNINHYDRGEGVGEPCDATA